MSEMAPEMQAIKARMKATWEAGDYGLFAKYLEPGALEILERLNIAPGSHMLDVGCGAGQIAIPAARAGVQVIGVDIAENLIEQARARAAVEGLSAKFDVGDAEQLPYPDASFDTVVSLIGAMFAPRPELVVAEFVRVCRSGGRIIMANWTSTGLIGRQFKIRATYAPPPPGVPAPTLWGEEMTVRERLSEGIADLKMTRRNYPLMKFAFSVPEVVEFYRQNFGPDNRIFSALDAAGQAALRNDLEKSWAEDNLATDGTVWIEPEYLEVIAIRA